jgi:hypothetical protein
MPSVPRKDKFSSCVAAGEFWPVVLATDPPTIMTEEEAYRKVPYMKVLHIPATLPRNEDGPPTQGKHAR